MKPLDLNWYQRFLEVGGFSANQYFVGDNDSMDVQKRDFLAGKTELPKLGRIDVDPDDFDIKRSILESMKHDLIEKEENSLVKDVYLRRLDEKLDELGVIEASYRDDWDAFIGCSFRLFGKPSLDIFEDLLFALREKYTEKLLSCTDDCLQSLLESWLVILPKSNLEKRVFDLPNSNHFTEVDALTLPIYRHFLSDYSDDYHFEVEDVKLAFEDALKKFGLDGWRVDIEEISRTAISVDHDFNRVRIPSTKAVSVRRMRELIVHEIGTHVVRRVQGERTKLKILGLGLDHYLVGEEGIATLREQVLSGEVPDYSGEIGFLSVGLALGFTGKSYNFRQLFEVLTCYYKIFKYRHGIDMNELIAKAKTLAWNRCVRTFRGVDCHVKGICYIKDIVYRVGNIAVWQEVMKNPKEVTRFNVGKYDPANEFHRYVLDQLS